MRSPTREVDSMLRDEKFTVWNLSNQPYNQTTIEHWGRYYWSRLQAVHDNGEDGSEFESDLHVIWMDLSGAIETLPKRERQAIDLLTLGYPVYGQENIAWKMGLRRGELRTLLQNAYKLIAERLA